MSNVNLQFAMDRIEVATVESQIAVFLSDKPDNVNAVFANSVYTRNLIENRDPDFLGCFHRDSDLKQVKRLIRKAAKSSHLKNPFRNGVEKKLQNGLLKIDSLVIHDARNSR